MFCTQILTKFAFVAGTVPMLSVGFSRSQWRNYRLGFYNIHRWLDQLTQSISLTFFSVFNRVIGWNLVLHPRTIRQDPKNNESRRTLPASNSESASGRIENRLLHPATDSFVCAPALVLLLQIFPSFPTLFRTFRPGKQRQ